MKRYQRGNAGTSLIGLLVALSAIGLLSYDEVMAEREAQPRNIANQVSRDIEQIQAAYLQCFNDYRRWCSSVEVDNYYTGSMETPIGGRYSITTLADGRLSVGVNTGDAKIAQYAKTLLADSSYSGTQLASTVKPPTDSSVFSDRLAAYDNASDPSRTQMATTWDFNNNNYNNLDQVGADNIDMDNLSSQTVTTNVARIGTRLNLGSNSVSANGGRLDINTQNAVLNGQSRLNGNINVNGGDIVSANSVAGQSGNAQRTDTTTFEADNATVSVADIQTATVQNAQGTSMNFASGTIDDTDFTNANGQRITTERGQAGTLNAQDSDIGQGSVNNVSGDNVTYTNGTIGNVSGQTATGNRGTFTNIASVEVSTGVLTGQTIAANIADQQNGTANRTSAGAYAMDALNSTSLYADDVSSDSGSANNVGVTNRTTASNVNANSASGNRFTTSRIVASTSSLGVASASSVAVSGTHSAEDFQGGDGDFDRVNGSRFDGGSYSSSGDFRSSDSSVNDNYAILKQEKDKLDNCMYVTEYCFPQEPVLINPSCYGDCVKREERKNFSADPEITVSQCKHGCDYSWSLGNGLSGSCSSGSVNKRGTKRVSCPVSASLNPEQSLLTSLTITAANARRSDLTDSYTFQINWENETTAKPPLGDSVSYSCNGSARTSCAASATTNNYKGRASSTSTFSVSVSSNYPNASISFENLTYNQRSTRPLNAIGSEDCSNSLSTNSMAIEANMIDGDPNIGGEITCEVSGTYKVTDPDSKQSVSGSFSLTSKASSR
jgi:hypothetical protein